MQPKTAQSPIDEVHILDTFQWYSSIWEAKDGKLDVPVCIDVLGYGYARSENQKLLMEAFEALTEKEQNVIVMRLGCCYNCFCPQVPRTYDEIADIYQFRSIHGIPCFYKRTLKKLRSILAHKQSFAEAD